MYKWGDLKSLKIEKKLKVQFLYNWGNLKSLIKKNQRINFYTSEVT